MHALRDALRELEADRVQNLALELQTLNGALSTDAAENEPIKSMCEFDVQRSLDEALLTKLLSIAQ